MKKERHFFAQIKNMDGSRAAEGGRVSGRALANGGSVAIVIDTNFYAKPRIENGAVLLDEYCEAYPAPTLPEVYAQGAEIVMSDFCTQNEHGERCRLWCHRLLWEEAVAYLELKNQEWDAQLERDILNEQIVLNPTSIDNALKLGWKMRDPNLPPDARQVVVILERAVGGKLSKTFYRSSNRRRITHPSRASGEGFVPAHRRAN